MSRSEHAALLTKPDLDRCEDVATLGQFPWHPSIQVGMPSERVVLQLEQVALPPELVVLLSERGLLPSEQALLQCPWGRLPGPRGSLPDAHGRMLDPLRRDPDELAWELSVFVEDPSAFGRHHYQEVGEQSEQVGEPS
jgi:hypothetical protein